MSITEGENLNPEGEIPNPELPSPTPEEQKAPEAKTFSQEQVNRIAATRAKEAEKAARQALADQFGMSLEDADKIIKETQAKKDAEKSELDRLREEKAASEKQSAELLASQRLEHHQDRVKLRLLKAGFSLPEDEAQQDSALDYLIGLVRVDVGASVEDIDASIAEAKTLFPQLLQSPSKSVTGNPSSNPSGTPRQPSLGNANADFGKQMAAKANAQRGVVIPTA